MPMYILYLSSESSPVATMIIAAAATMTATTEITMAAFGTMS